MDCSPSGSSVHGISQARVLEWVAISTGLVSLKCVVVFFLMDFFFYFAAPHSINQGLKLCRVLITDLPGSPSNVLFFKK